jgi:Kef-type K+ transport system membrane component KefB
MLAPVFFLHAGMQIDLTLVTSEMLLQFVILFVVAVGLKFAGTAIATNWLLGHSGTFVGVLFNYRLAFGIATASVGLKTGVITDAQYSIILLVIVCSAFLPALFLHDTPNELESPDPERQPPTK